MAAPIHSSPRLRTLREMFALLLKEQPYPPSETHRNVAFNTLDRFLRDVGAPLSPEERALFQRRRAEAKTLDDQRAFAARGVEAAVVNGDPPPEASSPPTTPAVPRPNVMPAAAATAAAPPPPPKPPRPFAEVHKAATSEIDRLLRSILQDPLDAPPKPKPQKIVEAEKQLTAWMQTTWEALVEAGVPSETASRIVKADHPPPDGAAHKVRLKRRLEAIQAALERCSAPKPTS